MWPWGHAAVGYLSYSLGMRARDRRVTEQSVVALAVGTQFPDLVDKPLGWTFGVLPGGRTLAHSLFAFAVVAAVVWFVASRYRRETVGAAFLIGYLTHPFADGLYAAIDGELSGLTYLLWPLLPMPDYETEQSFVAHFAQLSLDSHLGFELALVVVASILWYYDGTPGVAVVRSGIAGGIGRVRERLQSGLD